MREYKIFKHRSGVVVQYQDQYFNMDIPLDDLINRRNLFQYLVDSCDHCPVIDQADFNKLQLLAPIGSQEIWASGVTYMRSKEARMEESEKSKGDYFYDKVYDADRPELFFKSTASRVVGPGEAVNIRRDSSWDVPEPELTLLISADGTIEGYTIGNDMSSRSIEGENPLYLPQAKTYDRSAAIGPCILVRESPLSPDTAIELIIRRVGKTVFQEGTNLRAMKRQFEELVTYLFRETSFPDGCFLMTGTGIVPPSDFTLRPGDEVLIRIEGIGELMNTVATK